LHQKKHIFLLSVFAVSLLLACNPTKDKWLNRKWHTLTGHYNIYFNGEQKLLDATTQLENGHPNNFNEILNVFPIGTEEAAKGVSNVLDEASKKFSGTIALHTVGSYTDDAYYGIARCHYYKRDYYAAIEAFQYIPIKYKNTSYKNLCNSWIARCYVGLDKLGEAEAIIGSMLTSKNYRKDEIAHIFATAADINIRLGKYSSAIENLNTCLTGSLKKEERIRYHFILGQLCAESSKKAPAIGNYTKVIKLIPAYDFDFNATINLTRLYDLSNKKNLAMVRRNLKRMANDDKNLDYLDQIYYELGRLEIAAKNEANAIKYLRLSSEKSTKNKAQKAKSLKELALLYFARKDYKNAQAYYDSTFMNLDPKDKDYAVMKATKLVLSDLITNLTVFEKEDSLQALSKLSKEALEKKVDNWIAAAKIKAELEAKERKKQEQIAASQQNNQSLTNGPGGAPQLPGAGSGAWYFYNTTLMAQGSAEFFSARKWGKRENTDYWRIAAKEKPAPNPDEQEVEKQPKDSSNQAKAPKEIKEEAAPKTLGDANKDAWLKDVPFTKEKLKVSNNRILEALNNLGEIYHEKLNNEEEAIRYLLELQKRFPLNEYEPKAYYFLHKAYQNLKNTKKSDEFRDLLFKEYPEHPYTLILQKRVPVNTENESNKALLNEYEKLLSAYKNGNYQEVIEGKSVLDKKYPGNTLKPKYEFLYTLSLGKAGKTQEFTAGLTTLVSAYQGTEYAEQASAMLKAMDKDKQKKEILGKDSALKDIDFDLETETPFYYVFALKNDKADMAEIQRAFSDHNEAYAENQNLRVNAMMSNEGYQLILIREFKNLSEANYYLETLKAIQFAKEKLKLKEGVMETVISVKNFRNALKDKKLEAYHAFYPTLAKKAVKLNK